jgi:hypothetical protein
VFKTLKLVFAVGSMACLAACAGVNPQASAAPDLQSYWHSVDKATGLASDGILGRFDLETAPFDADMHYLDFSLVRHERGPAVGPSYTLKLTYYGAEALHIGVGQTLAIVVNDSDRLTLSGPGSPGTRAVDPISAQWSESASYPVTRAQLSEMASANKVEAFVDGDQRKDRGLLQEQFRQRIGTFLKLFKDGPQASVPPIQAAVPTAVPTVAK